MALYDTVENADIYFASRLHSQDWTESSSSDKTKALTEATRRIDRLRFSGEQVDDSQELEFPRYYGTEPDGTEEIPDDIKIACFEIAIALLSGIDPEIEFNSLSVTSRGMSGVTTNYDKNSQLMHIANGIPSALAWSYLRQYLAPCRSISVRRKS